MSEYWKSTPNYWCTHCKIYVRDSKLARANHDATPKHQGAIKRVLTNLHRDHERNQRESERAKREVERLNSAVNGGKDGGTQYTSMGTTAGKSTAGPKNLDRTGTKAADFAQAERQRQLEQLVGLGVNIPTPIRQDMAMPGEWTVASTRVIKDDVEENTKDGNMPLKAKATGVRKRELEKTEEELEEEDAVNGLFKKPRRWGRDSKMAPGEGDAELDALLSGSLARPIKAEAETEVEEQGDIMKEVRVKEASGAAAEDGQHIKQEHDASTVGQGQKIAPNLGEDAKEAHAAEPPPVLFKKRKPKNIRQK